MSQTRAQRPRNRLVNASGRANGPRNEELGGRSLPVCQTCARRLYPSAPWQIYCSNKCRLLAWAARELVKASRSGKVPGLGDIIDELKGIQ
jgi:hypothetical protein